MFSRSSAVLLLLLVFSCCSYSEDRPGEPEATAIVSQTVQTVNDCSYTVHTGSSSGPIATSVAIGSDVFHRFQCQPHTKVSYCLLISNCSVSTSSGAQHYRLLDGNGCSLEPSLIESVDYKGDLEAVVKGQAIRFTDDSAPKISMSCQHHLELKGDSLSCASRRHKCGGNSQ